MNAAAARPLRLTSVENSVRGMQSNAATGEMAGKLTAVAALPEECSKVVKDGGLEPSEKYQPFIAVVDRDACSALAAIDLVLAQSSISSQLIDNLNPSIHLRALLTDLFLFSEILRGSAAA